MKVLPGVPISGVLIFFKTHELPTATGSGHSHTNTSIAHYCRKNGPTSVSVVSYLLSLLANHFIQTKQCTKSITHKRIERRCWNTRDPWYNTGDEDDGRREG